MRLARILVTAMVVTALAVGFAVDGRDRPAARSISTHTASVSVAGEGGVWFCPGGSSPSGPASVSLELINTGVDPAGLVISGIRSGTGPDPATVEVTLSPGERRVEPLAEIVADSAWMGAMVESDSADVIVEQTYIGAARTGNAASGTDRSPCLTRTSTSWIIAAGQTRDDALGEQETLLVLNPFLDDAVLDISFDSDVGVESIVGVVVPAQRVAAIDITSEVTVASRVSAVIDVVAGRVAVSRVQVLGVPQDPPIDPPRIGLAVTPGTADAAPVWYLPTVHRGSRDDVITVVNPSSTETAQVDLEIVADGDLRFDPIELTIRPGRSVAVPLAAEERLDDATVFSVIARSLSGQPIAVMIESSLPFGDGVVSNFSATSGSDIAATRWIAPVETDEGAVVILNPSLTSIATASVSVVVDGEERLVAEFEIGPGRRAEVATSELEADRPIVVVDASVPVVVGREFDDVSVHVLAMGIAASPPVTDVE